MNILYVTGEAAPFCKTGGLADVSGSLPVALAKRGHRVAVILPLYNTIAARWRQQMTFRKHIYVDLSWRHEYCGLFSLDYQGVTWYFVDNEHYFARGRLYGEGDDGERFGFFSQAVNLYRTDIHRFRQVQKRGMTDDFSWDASAGAYESLYQHITGQTRSTK